METMWVPGLLACSGPGAGAAIYLNTVYSQLLAAVTGLMLYASMRRWFKTKGRGTYPAVFAFLLLLHPAWTVSAISGDCGHAKFETSVLVTIIGAVCLVAQWLHGPASGTPRTEPHDEAESPVAPPPVAADTRFFAGDPPRPVGVYAGEPPKSEAESPAAKEEILDRFFLAIGLRLLAAVPVGLFANAQYRWYLHERWQWPGNPAPNWVLGPLYFLVNTSPADDWIGYALLAIAVPCILSVVVWPSRWTALVASLTAWAWVIPATVKALVEPS